jgi:hypothetical protein
VEVVVEDLAIELALDLLELGAAIFVVVVHGRQQRTPGGL